MPLKIQLLSLGQDRSGRVLFLKDKTGHQYYGRNSGYADNQPGLILSYYLTFSRIGSINKLSTKIDGTNLYLPKPEEIAMGAKIPITSSLLIDNSGDENISSSIFSDGILDINMYVEFAGLKMVTINSGESFITGGNFQQAYNGAAIQVEGKIYEIDKSKDHNGFSVLYILGVFEADSTEFNYLYRSNVKAMLQSVSDDLYAKSIVKLSKTNSQELLEKSTISFSFKEAASIIFSADNPDLEAVDKLLLSANKLLKEGLKC